MPLYEYRCGNQHLTRKLYRVRDYVEAVDCDQCDLAAVRIFTPPVMVKSAVDVRYHSPIDGRPITSHAARQDDLKRHDCIPYDPEIKKDAVRWQKERQDAFDAKVDQTVSTEIARMPSRKRQELVKEVVGMGAILEVNRS
jgi:hypothetical protein